MKLHNGWMITGCWLSLAMLGACAGDDGQPTISETNTMSETETDTEAGSESNTNTNTNTNTETGTTVGPTGTMGMTMGSTGTDSDSDTDTMGTDTMGAECGNGVLEAGEECDDGEDNGTPLSMCDENCELETGGDCGDGNLDVGEECDDGNNDDGDGCNAACEIEVPDPVCGNGVVEMGEECDDANMMAMDGCEDDCTISPSMCGNGILEEWGGELCDDGNMDNNDGCEDDCTPTPVPECIPAENYISCDDPPLDKNDPMAPYHAIGLACSNDPTESILISNTSFNSPDAGAWELPSGYGTMGIWPPQEGASYIIIGSGNYSDAMFDGNNVMTLPNNSQVIKGGNQNPDDNQFLPMYTPNDDDSGVLAPQWALGQNDPNDKIWFSFQAQAPSMTEGYSVSFAFFSSEWPVYVQTQYNDLFVIWVVTDMFTGSISVIDGLSTTITSLHDHWSDVPIGNPKTCGNFGSNGPGYSCAEPELQGTGYETHAGTGWATINQPIEELTDLEMYFFLADMGDTALATSALVDNFRWSCDECIPVDDPLCTGEVPDPDCCGVILPE